MLVYVKNTQKIIEICCKVIYNSDVTIIGEAGNK